MASSSPLPRREPDGHGTEVRLRIAAAARDLFAAQGYENTTVEAIAERAGVARRTFFRHFRSKDDAIFPDHARIAALTEAHLAALQDVPPLSALASGVRMIFRSYADDPVVSVERYRLTRLFPALRDRETASVSRYTRLLADYLRRRYGDVPGAGLRSEAVAAAYVAAHNHVLRTWLQSSGKGDPMPALDAAFEWVAARFGADLPGAGDAVGVPTAPGATAAGATAAGATAAGATAAGATAAGATAAGLAGVPSPSLAQGDGEDVVVAVFRSGEPIDDVVERISRHL